MKIMTRNSNPKAGFSLVEMLIVIAILSIVMGAIFSQINLAQRNTASENIRLDLFQQTREFTDQLARDLRAAGYPSSRNFQNGDLTGPNVQDDPRTAVGLVNLDAGDLWFEAAVDGTDLVKVIKYHLEPSGLGCPCLRRSETPKVSGSPLSQPETYITEVQNVENGSTEDPIFTAYKTDGTQVGSLKFDQADIANINSIAIKITVRTPITDHAGNKPSVTMMSTVRLTNCSQGYAVAKGQLMGCF